MYAEPLATGDNASRSLKLHFLVDHCDKIAVDLVAAQGGNARFIHRYRDKDADPSAPDTIGDLPIDMSDLSDEAVRTAALERKTSYVDLYINVRVSNGNPKALDTLLRVRFTVAYADHEPSALHTWNTRASEAAKGVIKTGVVGDAPEGGKEQHEDTTVVVA